MHTLPADLLYLFHIPILSRWGVLELRLSAVKRPRRRALRYQICAPLFCSDKKLMKTTATLYKNSPRPAWSFFVTSRCILSSLTGQFDQTRGATSSYESVRIKYLSVLACTQMQEQQRKDGQRGTRE